MIYFIQRPEGGPIKIGTAIAVNQRVKALSCEYRSRFSVLAVMEGDRTVEASLHDRFSHLGIENEWFSPGSELTRFIEEHGKAWKGKNDPKSNGIPRKVQVSITIDQCIWDALKRVEADTGAKPSVTVNRILREKLGLSPYRKF